MSDRLGRRSFSALCLAWIWLVISGAVQAETVPAETQDALRAFLVAGNIPECVYVSALRVRQDHRALAWYEQTGNEERRENLRERPILAATDPTGPFVRGREVIARVERNKDLEIHVSLERVSLNPDGLSVNRTPLEVLYVYFVPGQEVEHRLLGTDGSFRISVPASPYCRRVRCQIRTGDERHELWVTFLNRRLPVTLIRGTQE